MHRVLPYPLVDFVIRRTGSDKFLKLHCIQPGKLPKEGAQPTEIEVGFAIDAEQIQRAP